jgi:hypothetical protein
MAGLVMSDSVGGDVEYTCDGENTNGRGTFSDVLKLVPDCIEPNYIRFRLSRPDSKNLLLSYIGSGSRSFANR